MSNNCLIFIYCKQIIVCFIAEYLSYGVVIVNMASSELIYGFPKKIKKWVNIWVVADSDIPRGKCPKGLCVIKNYVLWCDEVQMTEACHKWAIVA